MKYHYKTDLEELSTLAADIESFANKEKIKPEIHYALNLCLDEILTNIISYGMQNKSDEKPFIELELYRNKEHVQAIMRDNGIKYNPLVANNLSPDVSSKVAERPIGGLGVYFLDQYMDTIEYKYENDLNTLTLRKNL